MLAPFRLSVSHAAVEGRWDHGLHKAEPP